MLEIDTEEVAHTKRDRCHAWIERLVVAREVIIRTKIVASVCEQPVKRIPSHDVQIKVAC